jgi:hypothetical protein
MQTSPSQSASLTMSKPSDRRIMIGAAQRSATSALLKEATAAGGRRPGSPRLVRLQNADVRDTVVNAVCPPRQYHFARRVNPSSKVTAVVEPRPCPRVEGGVPHRRCRGDELISEPCHLVVCPSFLRVACALGSRTVVPGMRDPLEVGILNHRPTNTSLEQGIFLDPPLHFVDAANLPSLIHNTVRKS